jgi:AAA domain
MSTRPSSGRLWLSIGEELGPTLRRVILLIDATALLEALKQRIEDVQKGEIGLNRTVADAVVGKKTPPANPTPISEALSDRPRNPGQSKALRKALTESITYVWGPPGCGKTHVLSEIVRSGYEAGKRILVCSNTNKAVDQVLYQLCENLGPQHRAMQEGAIVRVGTIADRKLESYARSPPIGDLGQCRQFCRRSGDG